MQCNMRKETHIRRECTGVADELPSLLRDLDPGLAVVSSGGDRRAGGPDVVDEELLLEAHRQSALNADEKVLIDDILKDLQGPC